MKKIYFTIFLALIVSIGTVFGSVKIGNLYYILYADQTAKVTHPPYQTATTGNYDSENLTAANIPTTVEYNNVTYDVTSVGDSAFWICNKLKSVTIPNSIVSIGNRAFQQSFMTSIVIPNSVTSIGKRAFFETGITSLTIGDNVTTIGAEAFSLNSGLTSVTVPENVASMENNVFTDCTQLKTVIWNAKKCNGNGGFGAQVTSFSFGNTVESIPIKCCYELTKITSITIPDNVKNIGSNAFYNCSGLTSVTIGSGVENIGSWAFYKCTGLTSIYIPINVINLGDNAFKGCTHLSKVIWNAKSCSNFTSSSFPFPSSILDNNPITSFVFGEDVDTIPAYLCYGMSNLIKISIPDNVKSIGDYTFSGCSSLYSVMIGNNVSSIGNYAFNQCTGLTSITIPNSVINIGAAAFYTCTGLTSVTLPNSVTSMGNGPFLGCTGLTAPVYNDHLFVFMPTSYSKAYTIPNGIKAIVGHAFYNCTSLPSVVIPNSVTTIGNYAFYACNGLTSATISNRATIIGVYAFTGCSSMTSIDIPNSITGIGDYAFQSCSALITATIGNGVTYLGKSAFAGCSGLTSVTINAETPPTFGDNLVFYNTNNCPIYVPCGTKSAYDSASPTYQYRFALSADCATTYTVTFKDWDGTILKTEQVEEGHSATAPANPTREGYTFTSWDKDFSNIQSDLIVTAQYTQNTPGTTYYTVTFKDWDGTILKTQQVEKGKSATAPADPTREGYTFTGWDKDFSNVQSDLIVTAQYTQNTSGTTYYTVTFKDWDGTVLKTQQVEKGKSATAPVNPTREGYTFIGWDKDFSNVQSNLIVTAQYRQNPPTVYYTVTFKDWDGTVLKTQQVEKGKSATAPANPTRDGYTFIGWDTSFANVQSDLIVTAVYQKNQTPVTNGITVRLDPYSTYDWSDVYLWAWTANGNIFYAWPGQKINKDSEGWYSYAFDENVSNVSIIWNNGLGAQTIDITGVTESTCYALNDTWGTQITASIVACPAEVVYYSVIFKDWDGTILKAEQVEEGKSATAPADPTRNGYTFIGWDKDFCNIQSDLVVNAQYQKDETPLLETITVRLRAASANGWSKVYLYYWADDIVSPAWPGVLINKDQEGWYTASFDESVQSVNIIWNNGSGAQTKDITNITESTCYKLNGTTGNDIGVTIINCDAQGIEDITVNMSGATRKVLINNQLFILRGDKIYSVQGQEVR